MKNTLILTILLAFLGCAGVDLNPKQTLLSAENQFNSMVTDYEEIYQLQSDTIKAKWREEIDPQIIKIGDMFEAWHIALESGLDSGDYVRAWDKNKYVLIDLLTDAGVIEEE